MLGMRFAFPAGGFADRTPELRFAIAIRIREFTPIRQEI